MGILKTIYYGLLFISAATLLYYRKRLPPYCIWFLPLFLLSFAAQVIEETLRNADFKSAFVFHIYQPIEFILLSLFYYQAFTNALFKKISITISLLFVVVCALYYSLNQGSFFELDFMDFVIEAVLVCILVVLYFINMLAMKEKIELKYFPTFWLNSLHLIFYGGCLFVMGLYFYLHKIDLPLAKEVTNINYFLNLFLYAGYSITFSCTKMARK